MMTFDKIALQVPTILLPRPGLDLNKWAVIACDQYTSEPEYWERVESLTAGHPSTLNLIFPEVHLESENRDRMIRSIKEHMARYLADGTLIPHPPGFILLDRRTSAVPSRKGLMVALDLEQYDYREGSSSLIRATEGTILDRLPPRIRVREGASIELPHIMVLIDDPERTVIEPLFRPERELVYDFELMMGGGHLKGYRVDDDKSIRQVAGSLERLADPAAFSRRYAVENQPPVLYAMGDGNHSFATAKAIWENLKKNTEDQAAILGHPARYALVELVNVHDPGLEFEPIHRVVFGVDVQGMIPEMEAFFRKQGSTVRSDLYPDRSSLDQALVGAQGENRHMVPWVAQNRYGILIIENPSLNLVVATLQSFLDRFLEEHRQARIDYIHGETSVSTLGAKAGNIGFFMPAIPKHDLFRTIILDGALPRKTFSMGEADEKRFYLECRRITR